MNNIRKDLNKKKLIKPTLACKLWNKGLTIISNSNKLYNWYLAHGRTKFKHTTMRITKLVLQNTLRFLKLNKRTGSTNCGYEVDSECPVFPLAHANTYELKPQPSLYP